MQGIRFTIHPNAAYSDNEVLLALPLTSAALSDCDEDAQLALLSSPSNSNNPVKPTVPKSIPLLSCAMVTCPFCDGEAVVRLDPLNHRKHHVDCPRCGDYMMDRIVYVAVVENKTPILERHILAGFIREQADLNHDRTEVTIEFLSSKAKTLPRRPTDKAIKLLRAIERSTKIGELKQLTVAEWLPRGYALDRNELRLLIQHLAERGLVKIEAEARSGWYVQMNVLGYVEIDKMAQTSASPQPASLASPVSPHQTEANTKVLPNPIPNQLDQLFGSIAGQPIVDGILGMFSDVFTKRTEQAPSAEQTIKDLGFKFETVLKALRPEQASALEVANKAIAAMDLGLADSSTQPILSTKLNDLLFAIGFDTETFCKILQAVWAEHLYLIAALIIWLLEQVSGIVAEIEDTLIPEHVARMVAQLEHKDIEFDDLSLGDQITARFFLGKKFFGRITPWESGIPLGGIFVGFRLTDVEISEQSEKNTLRFTIVNNNGRTFQGTIALLGLDAFDRLIRAMLKKHFEEAKGSADADGASAARNLIESQNPHGKMTHAPDSEGSVKRFRIAFSFSGTKRDFIAKVSQILAARFGEENILYDKFHEAEFARRDLGFHLPDLYHNQSDLIVVVVCPDYELKEWCGLEWDATFDLLKKRQNDAVMLCRFEHATVKGLYSTAGFVELDDKTPDEAATLILQRLARNQGQPRDHYLAGP